MLCKPLTDGFSCTEDNDVRFQLSDRSAGHHTMQYNREFVRHPVAHCLSKVSCQAPLYLTRPFVHQNWVNGCVWGNVGVFSILEIQLFPMDTSIKASSCSSFNISSSASLLSEVAASFPSVEVKGICGFTASDSDFRVEWITVCSPSLEAEAICGFRSSDFGFCADRIAVSWSSGVSLLEIII